MQESKPSDELLHENINYERRDVKPFYIAAIGVFMIVSAVVIYAAVWGLYRYLNAEDTNRGPRPTMIEAKPTGPPEPHLQVDPIGDLQQKRTATNQILSSYGWVDQQNGYIRIPIDKAMDMIATKGLPSVQGMSPPVNTGLKTTTENPQEVQPRSRP